MKLKLNLAFIVILFGLAFLSGCATSRGEVELAIPVATNTELSNGKEIYINSEPLAKHHKASGFLA